MNELLATAVLGLLCSVGLAAEGPAHARLTEILARLKAGDEAALASYVDAAFTPAMRKAGPGDPGILPFLLDLSRRHRGFEVVRTLGDGAQSLTAVVRSTAEPTKGYRLNLSVEPAPPHRVAGLFLLAAAPGDLPVDGEALTAVQALEHFRRAVSAEIDRGFSGVVLLAQGDTVLLQRAGGEADRAHHVPNGPDTVFGLGSMNKMFTAVAVAQLVEQGKLAFADPIGRHVKGWLPDDLASSITIDQLLTHTSGLGDYLDRIELDPKLRAARSLSAYRELVRESTLQGKPEDGLRYSNTGYVVLGALIEAVTGRDYYTYVREEIYRPAGMTRTDSWCRDEVVENQAIGYIPPADAQGIGLGKGWRSNQGLQGTRGTPAGGGMSTAPDLHRFARALVSGKLVKPETLETLLTPRVPFLPGSSYAYGFVVHEEAGARTFGHSGGFPGVSTTLRFAREGGYTLVVLSNVSNGAGPIVEAWSRLAGRIEAP
jgi:CubicO group peptidase (beta-lactamase class C family)